MSAALRDLRRLRTFAAMVSSWHSMEIGTHEDEHGRSDVEYCGECMRSWPCPTTEAIAHLKAWCEL